MPKTRRLRSRSKPSAIQRKFKEYVQKKDSSGVPVLTKRRLEQILQKNLRLNIPKKDAGVQTEAGISSTLHVPLQSKGGRGPMDSIPSNWNADSRHYRKKEDKSLCTWLQHELDKDLKSVGGRRKNQLQKTAGSGSPAKGAPSQQSRGVPT